MFLRILKRKGQRRNRDSQDSDEKNSRLTSEWTKKARAAQRKGRWKSGGGSISRGSCLGRGWWCMQKRQQGLLLFWERKRWRWERKRRCSATDRSRRGEGRWTRGKRGGRNSGAISIPQCRHFGKESLYPRSLSETNREKEVHLDGKRNERKGKRELKRAASHTIEDKVHVTSCDDEDGKEMAESGTNDGGKAVGDDGVIRTTLRSPARRRSEFLAIWPPQLQVCYSCLRQLKDQGLSVSE